MCLLVRAARVALELVVAAERLRIAEVPEAPGDGGVLLHVDAQVEEVLVLARHRLAVQAAGLARQDTLEGGDNFAMVISTETISEFNLKFSRKVTKIHTKVFLLKKIS